MNGAYFKCSPMPEFISTVEMFSCENCRASAPNSLTPVGARNCSSTVSPCDSDQRINGWLASYSSDAAYIAISVTNHGFSSSAGTTTHGFLMEISSRRLPKRTPPLKSPLTCTAAVASPPPTITATFSYPPSFASSATVATYVSVTAPFAGTRPIVNVNAPPRCAGSPALPPSSVALPE